MASILIVDDNPTARQFVAASLKHLPHQVRVEEPTCLFRVYQALHEQPPDLLIADLIMPECPGLTLLRLCREDAHLKHVKIILLTSGGDADVGRFIQLRGNIHYLAKPVTPSVLADCVEGFLAGTLVLNQGWDLSCKGVVAIVDDSRMTRTFHAACLRKLGYRPIEIEPTDLSRTLAELEDAQADLVLLDYSMPSFNGEALLRAVRASRTIPALPVLMVTAHQAPDVEARMAFLRGVGFAYKPVSVEDLGTRVQRMLEGILGGP